MANKPRFSTDTLKKITLSGYFSLLFYMPFWLIIASDDSALSIPLILVMFVLPLLFPLKGLVQGNPYTYAWSNFIVMIYFLHSLTTLWVSADEKIWALGEFILASIMFIAGSYYAKYRGQELGLSIRKKKDE
ncbi:DUF2069 domain-containing protein [Cognaticolwellia aestuarii]|jgi:uncharacterized membrane protein|uniref:DUF2069 domain-containing protein n=1 Tax=Cognaticolwellia aestuarii TaxID=329993 RepID=UPI0011776F80|nr:DUF2069 domain-containing protein [Cognaticolwellia aestuarii]|tara:strand:- start:2347 stop:2742 length:396 start_codon:yes stop_codon:yes gene_type:complete